MGSRFFLSAILGLRAKRPPTRPAERASGGVRSFVQLRFKKGSAAVQWLVGNLAPEFSNYTTTRKGIPP